jgi:uncharacterized protein
VKTAVANILRGDIEVHQEGEWSWRLSLEGRDQSSLERFQMILQRDRIRAAARAVLRRSVEGNRIVFFLNKQAAYAGHVSFSAPEGESPLGPISVVVESENLEQLIDWLTGQPDEAKPKLIRDHT